MYVPTEDFASPEDEYQGLLARAKEAVTRRLDEIAYDMDRTYGSKRAAERLGVSQQLVIRRRNDHKRKLMHQPAADNEIATYFPGRGVPGHYPLLERVMETHDMGASEAHEAIHAYLDQLIGLDGRDAVVLSERPIRPELAESNPGDVDVHYWLTIDAEAIAFIEDAIANAPADDED